MNVGAAMMWSVLHRHRLGLLLSGGYMLLVASVVLLFRQDHIPDSLSVLLFAGLIVSAFFLVTVFIHPDSDVAASGSTYPNHYFTLPVATRDLVLWPVALGIAVMGGVSLALGWAIHSSGYSARPLDMVMIAVCSLTYLQAIFWYPFGIPYSKLILTVVGLLGETVLFFLPELLGFSTSARPFMFLAATAASIVWTAAGVRRARVGADLRAPARSEKRVKVVQDHAPFKSAQAAQIWYEWRQHGKVLPALAFGVLVVFFIPLYWDNTLSPVMSLHTRPDMLVPILPTYLISFYPFAIALMAVYGWAVGCGAKRSDVKKGDRSLHLFFGTRPLSDESIVWIKYWVAAKSTLVAWTVLGVMSLPLLLMHANTSDGSGFTTTPTRTIFSVLLPYLNTQVLAQYGSVIAICIFLTWRNYVIGFWTELSGSLAWRYIQPAASPVIYAGAIAVGSGFKPLELIYYLPYAFGAALAVKLTLAVWLAASQLRSGLVEKRSTLIVFGCYLAMGAALIYPTSSVLHEMLNGVDELAPRVWTSFVLLAFLCVPLVRILLPVSCLAKTRHR